MKVNMRNVKNIQNIEDGHKIYKDLLIGKEGKNIILFDLKLEKKILDITFHNKDITSIHICKKPLYIDDKEILSSNDSFYSLSSSLDKKFALHQISYNNLTSEYSNYKLISQCQQTHDEINGVIQIENGQILIASRNQRYLVIQLKMEISKNYLK